MSILKNNDTFAGSYVVRFFIKEGSCAETYRVCDIREQPFFLKIFDLERIPAARLTKGGMPFEVEMCARLEHPSLVACRRTGIESIGDKRYAYLITDYIQGGLLAELLSREHRLPVAQAVELTIRVLEGLSYLHGQAETLIHNDITARNIMYDCVGDALLRPRIIDMGHLSHPVMGRPDFQTSDLELCYRAPETFIGIYSKLSDLFSVGVLLYEMIYGCPPWSCDASKSPSEVREELREARKAGLRFPEKEPEGMTEQLHKVLQRALALIDRDRFGSADEFIGALRGEEVKMPPPKRESAAPPSANGDVTTDGGQRGGEAEGEAPRATFAKGEGNGFADVAGMEELKQLLRAKVINVLQDRERALKYRLAIPNGMLLYGPPGCGKTFIAEKFAEETGFNYTVVKSSDLASIYIHGSQQMIGKLFDEARAKAPTVLCFDEFDALVPSRKESTHASMAGEVNEFLSQLNNCGKKGVFVIATSNRPDMIDPAVLRTGRIDRMIYVPVPDKDARRVLFEINLKGRPTEDVDCAALAERTVNFVASDIAYAVNDAAITAAFANVPISQKILCETLDCMRPSVTEEMLAEYDKLRDKMTGMERRAARTPIGFKRQTH